MISAADPVPFNTTTGISCKIFRYKSSIVPGVPRINVAIIGKPSSLHGLVVLDTGGTAS